MSSQPKPLIPASTKLPELTFKVIILSVLLAAVMSAANAYLALKIGQTISASIPASVLAIGILKFFRNSNVLESNIIQTSASAGEGVAAAISFVLPGMILLQAWSHFNYWETVSITILGGLMGVFFSIPLRRIFLSMPTLSFPEGTAVGNVLKITAVNSKIHMRRLVQGIGLGGFLAFAQSGIQIFSDSFEYWTRAGSSLIGLGVGFSPAIFAAGYIVGVEVGVSLFTGFALGWLIVLPYLSIHFGIPTAHSLYDSAMDIWDTHLRFVGVGVMLVGGVWTLIRLVNPVIDGLKLSYQSYKKSAQESTSIARTEKDMPILWAGLGVLACLVGLYFLIMHFAFIQHLYRDYTMPFLVGFSLATVLFLLVIGFFLATICGYFTGLVGSSNNPLSGILILAILLLGCLYMFLIPHNTSHHQVAALMILVTTVVATCASISNENLQDLKAGQMVGATPWKQQLVLCIGVIVSAFVIAPVLELLFQAYGMGGVFPHPGMSRANMLSAPQASLMASVIKGIRTHQLRWNMIALGAGIAVVVIMMDEIMRRKINWRLPALAVGLGIYLPPDIILPTVIGGVIKFLVMRHSKGLVRQKDKEMAFERNQHGILVACGLVAGAALMGVFLAIPFVIAGSANVWAIMPAQLGWLKDMLGIVTFLMMVYWMYSISRFKK